MVNTVDVNLSPAGYRKILAEVERTMEVPVADPAQREIIARLEVNGILLLETMRLLHEMNVTLTDNAG